MKSQQLLVSCLFICTWLVVLMAPSANAAPKEKDPERKALYRLEYIDIEKVLDNNRMLTNFIRCFLRQGPCTPEARDFRKLLPKLAKTMCSDCTARQRYIIKKVFKHLMEERPKEWELLMDRFDPQRKYAERLDTFMVDMTTRAPVTSSPMPSSPVTLTSSSVTMSSTTQRVIEILRTSTDMSNESRPAS
ncbi:ejaculatory bulb-specific protein 3 [Nilaparvata lugens]|uniref:Chemosensory protein 9 n=1 Tax=Nilaparvata lugens TaxID=108931 RepID=B7TVH5_NILLU|nr:ejaculatory bulb-specific protein 3 [Nilaparvata lugens]ACJ64055.1 putative chemosensory protein CSP9 [Nilaparvata lugens]ASL05050.1 chemosensory protein 9 [Nilaparvata lugens]